MRILHVIPSIAPRYGGPSAAVVGMATACGRQGVDVLIATTNADGPATLPVKTGEPVAYKDTQAVFFTRQFSEAFKYSRPLVRWLGEHVTEFDAVHVHAVFSHASLAAGRACRAAGVPYIVRPLGTLDPWSLTQKWLKKRVMWLASAKRLVDGAAAMHYTTTEEQRLAEQIVTHDRGVVIPVGIDLQERSSRAFAEQYILFIGRLHPKKNVDVLIDAFGAVVQARPDLRAWRLVVAGDGDAGYVETLRRRAEAAAPARIDFTGWLDGARKRAVMENAAAVALISHQENFGIVAVEGLALGVPVLLSPDVNLARDVSDAQAGWIVQPNRNDVAQGLEAIMTGGPEREARGRAGQRFAAQFAWPQVARRLTALYTSISRN